MSILDHLAERRILEAMAEGAFENLPGAGAPVEPRDLSMVPETLRPAYLILKNAHCLPRELAVWGRAGGVDDLLQGAQDSGDTDVRGSRRLRLLLSRLKAHGRPCPLWVQESYGLRLHARLRRPHAEQVRSGHRAAAGVVGLQGAAEARGWATRGGASCGGSGRSHRG